MDEQRLRKSLRRLIEMLETEEESDSGRMFHPTTLQSCRIEHTMELGHILYDIKEFIDE